mgnify:CR=1 FL=1
MTPEKKTHRSALPLAATLALLAASPFVFAGDPAAPADAPAPGAELPSPAPLPVEGVDRAEAERGRYLVTVSVCGDCHTPLKMGEHGPEPDMSRFLAGHPQELVMPTAPALPEGPWQVVSSATVTAWNGPWGTSFTANLTPDEDTGLGLWTYENFRDTIRSGRHLGRGREILPPMPIPMFRHFSDADLKAIYAYLRSIPPVSNRVPEPLPPPAAPAAN